LSDQGFRAILLKGLYDTFAYDKKIMDLMTWGTPPAQCFYESFHRWEVVSRFF